MTQRKSHETITSLLKSFDPHKKDAVLESSRSKQHQHDNEMRVPSEAEILSFVLDFANNLSPEGDEETIVRRFLDILGSMFPGRRFAMRLLSTTEDEVSIVIATSSIFPQAKERIIYTDSVPAPAKLGATDHPPQSAASYNQEYQPIFEENAFGFDVVLTTQSNIIGVLNVEYPPGVPILEEDRDIIARLARPLSGQLLNARLLSESLYLRNYLSKLLEHANVPIIVIGRHRKVKVANRAFLALIGKERHDILDLDFMELCVETERARLLPVFINALRGLPTTNFELRVLQDAGGTARLSLNVASVLNPQNEVEGVICIGQDLTAIRELEEQVVQAEKLATLGQLATGVVHELNNPLTSISVYTDYLLKKAKQSNTDPKDIDRLQRIAESAERILRFTRDLVTYARPSTAEPKRVSIHDLLDQAIVFCEHLVAQRGITVEKSYAPEQAEIFAIPSQLHQVFINLITNACHAIDRSDGRLLFRTFLDAQRNIHVEIVDNGSGIPQAHIAKIFEPFFSTKSEGQGTGLGLSIARSILEQHNGHIHAHSIEEQGTTFELILPGASGESIPS